MGALDIKQAEHDCSTCADRTKPNVYGNCNGCDAPDHYNWRPVPTPPPVIPYDMVELPYGIDAAPPAVRHIYICAKYGIPLKAQFVAAEQLGNAPIVPLRWVYQTFLMSEDEYDRDLCRLSALDQIEKAAAELWIMGDSLDDDMWAEIEQAIRLELPVRHISDADIAAWDKRRREG